MKVPKIEPVVIHMVVKDNSYRSAKSLTIPSGTTHIQEKAFEGCYKLREVKLSEGLKHIGKEAFRHSGIQKITIPDSVTQIEEGAFEGCEKLKTATLSQGLVKILDNTFDHSGIEKIVIPDSVEYIGKYAFAWCENLCEIELSRSLFEKYNADYGWLYQDIFYGIKKETITARVRESFAGGQTVSEETIKLYV